MAGCLGSADNGTKDAGGRDADVNDASVTDAASVDAADANPGPRTLVVGSLVPDAQCMTSTDSAFLLRGMYDVAESDGCGRDYVLPLLIHNWIVDERPDASDTNSPATVHTMDAAVTLLDEDGSLIDGGSLSNPFRVMAFSTIGGSRNGEPGAGVALVRAIPQQFRPVLRALGGFPRTVIVQIALEASADDNVRVDPEVFRFPVELCVACLTHCKSALSPDEINTLTNGRCVDNAGADGRVCIDQGC